MKRKIAVILGLILLTTVAFAQVKTFVASPEVAKESAAKAKATAGDKITKQMVVNKVNKLAKLIEKEGSKAFPKLNGKDSEFIFSGTYAWVHDLNGLMRTHPIKPKMASGKSLLFLKDKKGNAIFVGMNKIAREQGAGWYNYVWPKPGEKEPSPKSSYVKLVKSADGEDLVIGVGAYDSDFSD